MTLAPSASAQARSITFCSSRTLPGQRYVSSASSAWGADQGDVAEVLQLMERVALPRDRILLMPEGIRREEFLERSLWVVEECRRHGFRYSPRLHILLWGANRGV